MVSGRWSLTKTIDHLTFGLDAQLSNIDHNTDEVFDRATLVRRSVLGPGGSPRRVAINSAGTVAVVANTYGWVDFIE